MRSRRIRIGIRAIFLVDRLIRIGRILHRHSRYVDNLACDEIAHLHQDVVSKCDLFACLEFLRQENLCTFLLCGRHRDIAPDRMPDHLVVDDHVVQIACAAIRHRNGKANDIVQGRSVRIIIAILIAVFRTDDFRRLFNLEACDRGFLRIRSLLRFTRGRGRLICNLRDVRNQCREFILVKRVLIQHLHHKGNGLCFTRLNHVDRPDDRMIGAVVSQSFRQR